MFGASLYMILCHPFNTPRQYSYTHIVDGRVRWKGGPMRLRERVTCPRPLSKFMAEDKITHYTAVPPVPLLSCARGFCTHNT